jgi:hypothetical protein
MEHVQKKEKKIADLNKTSWKLFENMNEISLFPIKQSMNLHFRELSQFHEKNHRKCKFFTNVVIPNITWN